MMTYVVTNIDPNNFNARIYAAFFLEMAKNYEEAEKEFKVKNLY